MSGPEYHIVFAGGGTGGHLFPAIALAEAFMGRFPAARVLFVSRGNDFERRTLARAGYALETIDVEGLKGRRRWQQLHTTVKLPRTVWQAMGLLRRFAADLVVGVGGYSSGPVVLAAKLLGCLTALHEQNIMPGITNRILARWVDRIYISFEGSAAFFDPRKMLHTGNPVRRRFFEDRGDVAARKPARPFTVLVVGGSQGAERINRCMIEGAAGLRTTQKTELRIIHQTGPADQGLVQDAYEKEGLNALVKPFFDEMPEIYAQADVVVCRAGATTIAEIAAMGKAAIFIPYPFAANDHQRLNAEWLVTAGAAEMILQDQLSGQGLWERIGFLQEHPQKRLQMAQAARRLGRPQAAQDVVQDCVSRLEATHRIPRNRHSGAAGKEG